jgi:CTP-dependent riboflavin kinase
LASQFVKGRYVSGWNHSRFRPNLYRRLGTWPGTINIQLPADTDERILIPNERVIGHDQIDANSNQDFLVRRCKVKGILGYQILPIDKTMSVPRGYHAVRRIEVALKQKIELQPSEELEVELQEFVVLPTETGHLL